MPWYTWNSREHETEDGNTTQNLITDENSFYVIRDVARGESSLTSGGSQGLGTYFRRGRGRFPGRYAVALGTGMEKRGVVVCGCLPFVSASTRASRLRMSS